MQGVDYRLLRLCRRSVRQYGEIGIVQDVGEDDEVRSVRRNRLSQRGEFQGGVISRYAEVDDFGRSVGPVDHVLQTLGEYFGKRDADAEGKGITYYGDPI